MYYKSGSQPDSWRCRIDPFPGSFSADTELLKVPNLKKLSGHYLQNGTDVDKCIGLRHIHQVRGNDRWTEVLYGVKQNFTPLLGQHAESPYLQECYTSPTEERILLAPISKTQYKELEQHMKENGPMSGCEFNKKMQGYCAEHNCKPFYVHNLALDEVRFSLQFNMFTV